jgi:hypothetical protein
MYANISFDENGQSIIPFIVLQNLNGTAQIVNASSIVYPVPTFAQRLCAATDHPPPCLLSSSYPVVAHNDTSVVIFDADTGMNGRRCNEDGTCQCASNEQDTHYSIGVGLNATCQKRVEEDYTYIDQALIIAGLVLFSLQATLSLGSIVWTVAYRQNSIVKVSQPIFLILFSVGCLIMALSIIPMSAQTEYRYVQDENTGELLLDEPNPEIRRTDAACMASVWLWGCGFALTFSALFAKIYRAYRIFHKAQNCERVSIKAKDVVFIVVGMVSFQVAFLIIWQTVSPWI